MQRSLFIGLVTHPKTRFVDASSSAGLAAGLARELNSIGWDVQTAIVSENHVEPSDLDLSTHGIYQSIRLEMSVERQWANFQGQRAPLSQLFHTAMLRSRELFRLWKCLRPTKSARKSAELNLLRLANIETAHIKLMHEGATRGSHWILILEDDAYAADHRQLAQELNDNLETWNEAAQPLYVNVSQSFGLDTLGIDGHLTYVGPWSATSTVRSSKVPFTNTVCAVIYRQDFLRTLNEEMGRIPLQPIIPIDWKLNLALMRLSAKGLMAPGDCYTVDPAPIAQGSMLNHD